MGRNWPAITDAATIRGWGFASTVTFGSDLRVNLSKSRMPESIARRDASFTIGPADARSMVQLPRPGLIPIEPTRIRQGRTATAGLLVVVVVIGIVITAIAVFA